MAIVFYGVPKRRNFAKSGHTVTILLTYLVFERSNIGGFLIIFKTKGDIDKTWVIFKLKHIR